jgi:hypothetical protein
MLNNVIEIQLPSGAEYKMENNKSNFAILKRLQKNKLATYHGKYVDYNAEDFFEGGSRESWFVFVWRMPPDVFEREYHKFKDIIQTW